MKWAWLSAYVFAFAGTLMITNRSAEVEEGYVLEGGHAIIAGASLVGVSALLLHSSIGCISSRRIGILLTALYPTMFLIPIVFDANGGTGNSLLTEIVLLMGFSLLFPLYIVVCSKGSSMAPG